MEDKDADFMCLMTPAYITKREHVCEELTPRCTYKRREESIESIGSSTIQFYKGGVFDGRCGDGLDHGVAAVGYGSSKDVDYIIVKNSWGPKWGEKGFTMMKRNTGKPQGLYGINKMASFPTKTK